jgi:multidrug efflux pump subunit AcrB
MKISDFSVRNWRFTLVVFLGILALGISSLLTMPRAEDPPYHAPTFGIIVLYPGTSPLDMEKLVVKPVEKRLQDLENLKHISTQIRDGVAVFRVEYQYGSNIDDKYQELTREMGALKGDLPPDLTSVEVKKYSSADVSIYQFALVSETQPYRVMKFWSDQLKDDLQRVKSLKSVDVWGYPQEQVTVELDLEKLAAKKIGLGNVLGAVQKENVNIPGGSLNAGGKKFDIKTEGEFRTVDDLRSTVVFTNGNQTQLLENVADIRQDYERETHLARLNGHRAIFVTVSMHEGQNIESVKNQVLPLVDHFRKSLPPTLDLVKVFDQPQGVETRLDRFSKDFLIAIVLVLFTLLPLGGRASFVVMIAIPLSLAIGLTLLYLLGYTINQLSIVGMIVALGILVDDSIVVVENTERWLRSGATRKDAAVKAAGQIAVAVMGCTVLLVFAFLPLIFLPEGTGEFIRSLPMAVVCCVLASLFVALTIVPFLSSRILKEKSHGKGNFFLRFVDRSIIGGTEPLVRQALARPKTTFALALTLFVLALGLFPVIGQSLFPKSDKPMFLVNVELPAGSNLAETDLTVRRVESLLAGRQGIQSVAANVGHDNPQIYYNVASRDSSENIGQLFVQLDNIEPSFKERTIEDLRKAVSDIPNAKIEVKEFEQGSPVDAPVAYRVYSEDLANLDQAAARVEALLKSTPHTLYVDNPLSVKPTDLRVTINREKAGLLGLSASDIAQNIRLGVTGLEIGKIRVDGREDDLPINVTLAKTGETQDLSVFDRLSVDNAKGVPIPLSQVAAIGFDTGVSQIRHYDQRRYVTVGAFLDKGANAQALNRQVFRKISALDLNGATVDVAGEAESSQESFAGIGMIILITIFGFIGVLILEFKSFKSILIVLSIIPMGVIGALAMLWFFHESFSFTATIGLIALTGIEVKNSLLFVDFANLLRSQGRNLEEAILEAGRMRFVPILLTSMTAIGGLIPLIVEYSPLYSPLAMVLIGGIVSSTVMARFVTPAMYKLLPPEIDAVETINADLNLQGND